MEFMHLCRLCLAKDGVNVFIFGNNDVHQIYHRITTCLPIDISKDDYFPKNICGGCLVRLELFHQFRNTALDAEKQLLLWLKHANEQQSANTTVFQLEPELLLIKNEVINIDEHDFTEHVMHLPEDIVHTPCSKSASIGLDDRHVSENTHYRNVKKRTKLCNKPNETKGDKNEITALLLKREHSDGEDAIENSEVDFISCGIAENINVPEEERDFNNTNNDHEFRGKIDVENCELDLTSVETIKTEPIDSNKVLKRKRQYTRRKSSKLGKIKASGSAVGQNKTALHECNVCKYKCVSEYNLTKHMTRHASAKSYKCNICSYESNQGGNFKRHMYKHTGERPFECNICDYKCATSSQLKVHINRHVGNKPHKCSICDYKTPHSSDLKKHMSRHTGEKPYKCHYCNFQNARRHRLMEHIKETHDVKMFNALKVYEVL